ncbi:MAG TPA: hypothetical protein VFQ44_11925 [Streptosporangiaceae bacterium]|nr:hypothetical protein [Streptosporangiaceae bacterium]
MTAPPGGKAVTAQTTAQRVLAWAAKPGGQPPVGPLWELTGLAQPESRTLALLADLVKVTAAKLGAGAPPFADASPIGAGPVLLAAAIGGRHQAGPAARLAEALPPHLPDRARRGAASWPDLVARHALTATVLAANPEGGDRGHRRASGDAPDSEPLGEILLRLSPLTAIVHRPARRRIAAGATGAEVEAAAALAARPRGQQVMTAAMACWSPDAAVLDWRVDLLDRLGHDNPALVLDTCTAARLHHGAQWDDRLRWARRQLSMPGPPDPLAIATIRFWTPLARLRQRGVSLPDARPLLTGYREALRLVRHHRLLTTGAL